MALTFPTMAEQAKTRIETTSTPAHKVAKEMGAETERGWDGIEHTFDDDTTLLVKGRGRNQRLETKFP